MMSARLWALAAAIAMVAAVAAAQESAPEAAPAVADPASEGVRDASAAAVEGEAAPNAAQPIADDGSEAQDGAAGVAAEPVPESESTAETEIAEEPLGDAADPAEPQPDAVPDAPEEPVPEGMITAVSFIFPHNMIDESPYEDRAIFFRDDVWELIFEDGAYTRNYTWETCGLDDHSCAIEPDSCDPDHVGPECYVDLDMAAELWFSVAYSSSSDNFTKLPVITMESGDSANPVLSDFFVKPGPRAQFRVKYRCESSGENNLKMTLGNRDGTSLDFKWIKICGSGCQEEQVLVELDNLFAVDFLCDDDPKRALDPANTVGADVTYTTVRMKILRSGSVSYGQPTIVTDDSVLTTNLRGNGAVAGTLYPAEVTFDVLYTCHKEGSVAVNLTIPIPPFDDIHKTWKKTCRGREGSAAASAGEEEQVPLDTTPADLGQEEEYEQVAQPSPGVEEDGSYERAPEVEEAVPVSQDVLMALEIGTENGLSDVVKGGVASEGFNIDFEDSMQVQDTHFRVDEDTLEKTFYVRNPAGSTTGQNVHKISLTVRDKRMLLAKVEKRITARFSLSDTGAVIGPNDTASLTIRFICKDAGETSVLVSMLTNQEFVEFGFVKQCREPVKYTERGFLRTATSLLHVVMAFFVVAACSGLYLYLRSRKGAAPYESVPTGTAQTGTAQA